MKVVGTHSELIHIRLAGDEGPCILEQFDDGGIIRADEVFQNA